MPLEWKNADEGGADDHPPWLVVGPGSQAAVHFVSVHLARMRQSMGIEGDAGFRSFATIVRMYDRGPEGATDVRTALELLHRFGMVEQGGAGDTETWRASRELVAQIDEAFSARPALDADNPA